MILISYMLSATACREWLKLPVLISHYLQHDATGSQNGLAGFLHDHYWHEESKDKDADEDARLPFHSSEYSNVLMFVSPEPRAGFDMTPHLEDNTVKNYPSIHDADIPSGYLSGFWQPPRMT